MKWPDYEQKYLEEGNISIVVQVNGKKRGLINLERDKSENDLFNLIKKDDKIFKYIKDKNIKKQIFIKKKIINFII